MGSTQVVVRDPQYLTLLHVHTLTTSTGNHHHHHRHFSTSVQCRLITLKECPLAFFYYFYLGQDETSA
jgi:hypothetical protein